MNYETSEAGPTEVEIKPTRRFKITRDKQIQLISWISQKWPRARSIFKRTEHIHHSMPPWESMLLAGIGTWFNYPGARILEIGGCKGGSASIWAEAAPKAEIHTLEPAKRFQSILHENLKPYPNITIWQKFSWHHFLETMEDPLLWDLIFVDGSHVFVHRDLPWWNRLKVGGLMFFDDYTPRIYPVVCAAVRDLWESMGLESADIIVRRRNRAGMAGIWKRKESNIWPDLSQLET